MAEEACWIQLTAARGPAECAWAVAQILPRFEAEARAAGLRCEALESVPGPEPGTLSSALLSLEGEDLNAFLAGWLGSGWRAGEVATLQWTGRSPFRPQHKRKNWFVGVAALAPPAGESALDPRDLRIDTYRAGGPGGQHVNTSDSAVRVVHVPTGLTAVAREERSQKRNKDLALARLAEMLRDRARQEAAGAQKERWKQHDDVERGSPVRVFKA